ncbi:FecR family protein [Novosphingobium sp.]|uniref:FecR family protein n=1 Tax=Novosphingobium sp. TaxID=1874826 RepID=UPI002FD9B39E
MNRDNDAILSEATHWHLASGDDSMDWQGFTQWLQADPRHRDAYDEIALTAQMLDEHRSELVQDDTVVLDAQDTEVTRPVFVRRARWAGFAIAASLAAILVAPQFLSPASQVYETAAASRHIALADGSFIVLAPRSRLTIEGRDQDHIALSGGALFDIRHDPSRQLAISASGLTISDIGTRFDIQAQDNAVRVAVVEGKVEVSADTMDAPVRLPAGKGLAYDASAGTATVTPVQAANVGSWQQGRLSYENARLALVVADLRRYAGVSVEVPAALRDRRFSGTLIVDNGDAALRDLVQLMGLRLGGRSGAWRLEQR